MRLNNTPFYLAVILLLVSNISLAQDGGTPLKGNTGLPSETEQIQNSGNEVPEYLFKELKDAMESGNSIEEDRVRGEISNFISVENIYPTQNYGSDVKTNRNPQPPFNDAWLADDKLVFAGELKSLGNRQINLKSGPNGDMYITINRKNITGTNGRIDIYKSLDGGASWALVNTFSSSARYFGQISSLVENRSATIIDSTRIIVFYTSSTNVNMLDANLSWISYRTDGTGFMGGVISAAGSGNKFFYPAAVSDGQYFSAGTFFGVVVGEYDNTTELSVSFRFFRTTNWGDTYTGVTLTDPGYPTFSDYFPTADFKLGFTDSIYIAVERRFANDTLVRVINTRWSPAASTFTQFITSGPSTYEKPWISIQQTGSYANNTRNVLVTCVKNQGLGVYHYSTNSGSSWIIDASLGLTTQNTTFTTACASDSTITGGGYFVAGYADAFFSTGDSITIRRGILGNLGPRAFQRNNHQYSSFIVPQVAIYNSNGSKFSAFSYVGISATNVYYDQENLPTYIQNTNSIPDLYRLSQNYPNPFNPATKIDYSVAINSFVNITVYDLLGREITTLVNKELTPGNYSVNFDASKLAAGLYFYKLTANAGEINEFSDIKKMILIK